MPTATAALPAETWIPLRRAAAHLGVGSRTLSGLINAKRLRVRRVPGGLPRVSLAEVLALGEAYTSHIAADAAETTSSSV